MSYKEAAQALKEASYILLSLGNGFNLDGGLQDYTVEGYFKNHQNKLEAPQGNWYVEEPSYDLGFFSHRISVYNKSEPNPRYSFLKELVKDKEYFVTTACTEGFIAKVFPSEKTYEVHGCIRYWHCTDLTCSQELIYIENLNLEYDEKTFKAKKPYPLCPSCGEVLRPNLCMTNDWSFNQTRQAKQIQNFNSWIDIVKSKKDAKFVILEVGAGLVFPTIRENDEATAKELNATLIRINPVDAQVPKSDYKCISLQATAKDAFEGIQKELEKL